MAYYIFRVNADTPVGQNNRDSMGIDNDSLVADHDRETLLFDVCIVMHRDVLNKKEYLLFSEKIWLESTYERGIFRAWDNVTFFD